MIDPHCRPKLLPGVLTQEVSGTQVLLNLGSGEYYALDEVGSRICTLCDGSRPITEVVDTLEKEYDAPRETLEADLLELLAELVHEKLVDCGP